MKEIRLAHKFLFFFFKRQELNLVNTPFSLQSYFTTRRYDPHCGFDVPFQSANYSAYKGPERVN